MKKLLLLILTLSIIALTSTSCGVKIEDETAFLAEVSTLIEKSYEINEILFGEGLPIRTDGKTPEEILAEAETPEAAPLIYLPITEDAKYTTEREIEEATAAVYSSAYCSFLNQLAFTGIASDDDQVAAYARYLTDMELGLTVNVHSVVNAVELTRTYDLSTLKIVRSQNGFWIGSQDYVIVSADAYDNGVFSEVKQLKIVRDNSGWRLDWPTY